MIVTLAYLVALVLALADLRLSGGKTRHVWAIVLIAIGLLWGRIG